MKNYSEFSAQSSLASARSGSSASSAWSASELPTAPTSTSALATDSATNSPSQQVVLSSHSEGLIFRPQELSPLWRQFLESRNLGSTSQKAETPGAETQKAETPGAETRNAESALEQNPSSSQEEWTLPRFLSLFEEFLESHLVQEWATRTSLSWQEKIPQAVENLFAWSKFAESLGIVTDSSSSLTQIQKRVLEQRTQASEAQIQKYIQEVPAPLLLELLQFTQEEKRLSSNSSSFRSFL